MIQRAATHVYSWRLSKSLLILHSKDEQRMGESLRTGTKVGGSFYPQKKQTSEATSPEKFLEHKKEVWLLFLRFFKRKLNKTKDPGKWRHLNLLLYSLVHKMPEKRINDKNRIDKGLCIGKAIGNMCGVLKTLCSQNRQKSVFSLSQRSYFGNLCQSKNQKPRRRNT